MRQRPERQRPERVRPERVRSESVSCNSPCIERGKGELRPTSGQGSLNALTFLLPSAGPIVL